MANMMLGGIPLDVNPEEVRWNFKMKVTDSKTLGGKVIQVLGTTLGDITIQGRYSPNRSLGEREAWEAQMRFRTQVDKWADRAINNQDNRGLRFTYAPRGWDFTVFVKMFSYVEMRPDDVAPPWNLVLFPLDARAHEVVKGVKDLYIKRLMNGIGWKQTEYNGPTQQEVDDELGGLSVEQYMAEGMGEAFLGQIASETLGGGGTTNSLGGAFQ